MPTSTIAFAEIEDRLPSFNAVRNGNHQSISPELPAVRSEFVGDADGPVPDAAAANQQSVPQREWDALLDKLIGFAHLKDGWDSYRAPAPSGRAVVEAFWFLSQLRRRDILPNRCAPSVVGGIGVVLHKGPREAYVEFYNAGGIHALLSDDRTEQMEDIPIGYSETDQVAFIARAQEYLNG